MKVSIIVPIYNEEQSLHKIFPAIVEQRKLPVDIEIIAVNDGSSDRSKDILDAHPEFYDHVIHRPRNGGKGAAVIDGLSKASGDYILFQDADLEYDPEEYAKLFAPVKTHNADIVIGSRFISPSQIRVFRYAHKIGNFFLSFAFNILNNTTFTDIYSCYFLYRRDLVQPSSLKTRGWEQQAEILGKAVKAGKIFYEVPISYHGRDFEEGKKIHWYHGFSVLRTILATRIFNRAPKSMAHIAKPSSAPSR